MAYQQKPNSGSLFINDKKETDKHPDYTGTALIDGKEYYISGWRNIAKSSGVTYLNLSFKLKDEVTNRQQSGSQSSNNGFPTNNSNFDDDVPF